MEKIYSLEIIIINKNSFSLKKINDVKYNYENIKY